MKNIVYSKLTPPPPDSLPSSPQKPSQDQFSHPIKPTSPSPQPTHPTHPTGFQNAQIYCRNLHLKHQNEKHEQEQTKLLLRRHSAYSKTEGNTWMKRNQASHVYRIIVKNCEREQREKVREREARMTKRVEGKTESKERDLSKLLIDRKNQYYVMKASTGKGQVSAYKQAEIVRQTIDYKNPPKPTKYSAKASQRLLDEKAASLMAKVCHKAAEGMKKMRMQNSMIQGTRSLHAKPIRTARDESYDNSHLLDAFNTMFTKS